MQALVWSFLVRCRAIWFSTSYVNLRQPHKFNCQLQEKTLVLQSSKYGNIIQVHIKLMKRLSLVCSPLASTHSLLYYGHMTFDWHRLGHKTRPGHCNMQNWRFSSDWSCMCVSWSLSYSTLFHSDLLSPPSELVHHSWKCLMFLSALGT